MSPFMEPIAILPLDVVVTLLNPGLVAYYLDYATAVLPILGSILKMLF
jgi:hypothetical protein